MDWGRYLRAVEVEHTQTIEKLRIDQIEQGKELPPEVWEAIQEHDELANG